MSGNWFELFTRKAKANARFLYFIFAFCSAAGTSKSLKGFSNSLKKVHLRCQIQLLDAQQFKKRKNIVKMFETILIILYLI